MFFLINTFIQFVSNRFILLSTARSSSGQATAEYAVVILIAVALGLAVLSMFTGGIFNQMLEALVKHVLQATVDKLEF